MLTPYLLALKRDKLPMAPLFGEHWRDWPRRRVPKICRTARVPTVCTHSMRGFFATLGIQTGAVPRAVAATLGHESPRKLEVKRFLARTWPGCHVRPSCFENRAKQLERSHVLAS